MDRKTDLSPASDPLVRRFHARYLRRIVRRFKPTEIWLFGSRVRGDAMDESDLDVLIVSSLFEGVPFPERTTRVLLSAEVREAIEFLCYTPAEFLEKKDEPCVVQAAVEEGWRVYPDGPSSP